MVDLVQSGETIGLQGVSLIFKVLLGFVVITAALILFLYYNNAYGMKILREEVSKTNYTLLQSHGLQMDSGLQEATYYLLRLITSDTSYPDLITLSLFPMDSSNYFFAKQRTMRSFTNNLDVFREVDIFFVYSKTTDDVIFATRDQHLLTESDQMIRTEMLQTADDPNKSWRSTKQGDHRYLYRTEKISPEIIVGAVVNVGTFLSPLGDVRFGDKGMAMLLDANREPINDSAIPAEQMAVARGAKGSEPLGDGTYRMSYEGVPYLLIGYPLKETGLELAAILPEQDLLRRLTFFQRMIYMIPIAGTLVLILYFLFLKKVLQKPLQDLMNGMRSIMRGNLEFRIAAGNVREFVFLTDTFNKMVTQIRYLKMDVYEEQLKKKEAEYKHLQAQINPHFYLNSLNLIYSLSELEENALVQKMTEHLAAYFRFIMRGSREYVTIEEETAHIRDYLEIQKLRFPSKMFYTCEISDKLLEIPLPPLSIQPFVENAVVHGMKKPGHVFRLDIQIKQSDSNLACMDIRVADNGPGFPPDLLRALQEGSYAGNSAVKHLGIWNVQERLRLKYGQAASFAFENLTTGGAEVTLTVPIEQRRGDEDTHD
ncbi:histidine kinase [Paenibacillus sp. Soil766]|uniref:sensor histidine kinase n=1 Tax=Paenibacillus sp. Soil766 TaxID=1736404 RepID=UPI001F1A55E2|nr:histidine kinase [Paenibacillus sp. Soil766]